MIRDINFYRTKGASMCNRSVTALFLLLSIRSLHAMEFQIYPHLKTLSKTVHDMHTDCNEPSGNSSIFLPEDIIDSLQCTQATINLVQQDNHNELTFAKLVRLLILADYLNIPQQLESLSTHLAQALTKNKGSFFAQKIELAKLPPSLETLVAAKIVPIGTLKKRLLYAQENIEPSKCDTESCTTFMPVFENDFIAFIGKNGTVTLRDMKTNAVTKMIDHGSQVTNIAYHKQAFLLATLSQDHTIKLWNLADGACMNTLRGPSTKPCALQFNKEATLIWSCSEDGIITCWDVKIGDIVNRIESNGPCRMFSMGDEIFTSTDQALLKLSGTETQLIEEGPFTLLTASNNQKLLAIIKRRSTDIFNIETNAKYRVSHCEKIVFSPDDQIVACFSTYHHLIELYQAETGKQLHTFTGCGSMVSGLYFSPDSAYIATCYSDNSCVELWESKSGRLLGVLQGHEGSVDDLAFSRDSTFCATCNAQDKKIYLWHVPSFTPVKTLRAPENAFSNLFFSADGAHLISYGSELLRWSLINNRKEQQLNHLINYHLTIEQALFITEVHDPHKRTFLCSHKPHMTALYKSLEPRLQEYLQPLVTFGCSWLCLSATAKNKLLSLLDAAYALGFARRRIL